MPGSSRTSFPPPSRFHTHPLNSPSMWLNLSQIVQRASHDPDVRAVILSGAGPRGFTAGLDVTAASQGLLSDPTGSTTDAARKATALRRHVIEFQGCVSALEACEKPVLIVMHGISYGMAVDLATAADVRIAAADARFSVKEVDIGLAADVGTLSRLPKAVGNASWVKEVCLSAREFGADEAARVGFLSRVAPSKEAALKEGLELAKLIASKSPVAVLGTKELLNFSRENKTADGLRYTAAWNAAMLQTQDVKDAMLSGLKKTKATFSKL
jgi:Delta3,5-Delta2,4-dienoyl-CoA isomerase